MAAKTNDWGYLGKKPPTSDHEAPYCLAKAKGAIGDCTRVKGHKGFHQGAAGYAWSQMSSVPWTHRKRG